MDKLTFKEWSILADLETIAPLGEDFEFSMARGELKTAQAAITRLMTKLKGEGDLEAWVQSKITKAAEYLDTVADHLSHGEDDTERKSDVKEGFKGHKSVEEIAKKHKVSPSVIQKQLEMGMKVEHEHTTDNDQAMDIALQHLDEVPDYYSKLKKVEKVQEMISTSAETGRRFRDISNQEDQRELEKEKTKRKKEKEEKYKKSLADLKDETREKGIRFYDKRGSGYIRDGKKQYDESLELHDANGNLFATIVDIIKGSDYKFKSFTQPIEEKCWPGYKKKGMKTMFGKRYPNCVKKEEVELQEKLDGKSSKDPGYSLKDWFNDEWVQTGGKYDGKPCAKQPGQTTKPYCRDPDDRATMDKDERNKRAAKKRKEDPNPNRSGAAKIVTQEESGEKDACYTKVKSRYRVWPSAYASGALVKCRKVGAANWGNKSKKNVGEGVTSDALAYEWDTDINDGQYHPLLPTKYRYCPKCKKNETKEECRYGPKYWSMFSLPPTLPSDPYDPNEIHPANENVNFEIGSGHKQSQKQAKIRNLATETTNPNKKSDALKKLNRPSLPLADSVIQPGQLTNEDYQRIQSTGNVYTILFSWRGRPMMNLQLFFPNMKRPSKDEVKKEIEKFYPGAVIMQWYPSPTDPSKPIVVIQGN